MIVQVIKPFREFIENQIIDTHKYGLVSDDVTNAILSGIFVVVSDFIEKIDTVSDTLIYKGKAYDGATDNDEVWTITKIETIGTQITKKTFHDVSWTNRTNL